MEIENDLVALDKMMADLAAYEGPLGPGPYWLKNQQSTLNWLKRNDLNGFRRYSPYTKALGNFSGGSAWRSVADEGIELRRLSRSLIYRAGVKLGISPIARRYGRRIRQIAGGAHLRLALIVALSELLAIRDDNRELGTIDEAILGDPSDLIEMDGGLHTPTFLYKFLLYLEIKKLIGIPALSSFLEIGPGAGHLDEIVAKLNPQARLYLVDIPPQLYVTQQVMKAIFPRQVVTYGMMKADPTLLRDDRRRIFALAPWQLDLIDLDHMDLFMSQAFEEMRSDTVKGYLAYADRWKSRYIFVNTVVSKPGYEVTTRKQYESFLPRYRLAQKIRFLEGRSVRPYDPNNPHTAGNPSVKLVFERRSDALSDTPPDRTKTRT